MDSYHCLSAIEVNTGAFFFFFFELNTGAFKNCNLLLSPFSSFQEARNIEDFLENFKNDPTVKIPRVYKKLSGPRVLVMEWIDGIRGTDPQVCLSVLYMCYFSNIF